MISIYLLFPAKYPTMEITSVAAIPRNKESIVGGRMNFPINTKTGPAIMAAIANFGEIFPGKKIAVHIGMNATDPRSPMDIKLHPRIRSPRLPQLNSALAARIATMMILVTCSDFSGLASLFTYTL